MRARVVRTVQKGQPPLPHVRLSTRTLGDVDIAAREAIEGSETGVHMHTMLQSKCQIGLAHFCCMRTESRTCPNALSSASSLSFSAMSSCSDNCPLGIPFE